MDIKIKISNPMVERDDLEEGDYVMEGILELPGELRLFHVGYLRLSDEEEKVVAANPSRLRVTVDKIRANITPLKEERK